MTNISGKHDQLSSLFNLLRAKLHLRALLPPANSDNRIVRLPRQTFLRPSAAVTGAGLRQLKEFNHWENILSIFFFIFPPRGVFVLALFWTPIIQHDGYIMGK